MLGGARDWATSVFPPNSAVSALLTTSPASAGLDVLICEMGVTTRRDLEEEPNKAEVSVESEWAGDHQVTRLVRTLAAQGVGGTQGPYRDSCLQRGQHGPQMMSTGPRS